MATTPVTERARPVGWRDVIRTGPGELRDRVRALPEEAWSQDPAALLALAASFRTPGDTNPYAAEPYLDAADELIAVDSVDPALRVLAPIVRSLQSRELGRFAHARGLLAAAGRELAASKLPFTVRVELQAFLLLHDGVCALFAGRIGEGRQTLLRALNLAGPQTPPALRAEASGCLSLIELRTGSLRGAEGHLADARRGAAEARSHPISLAPVRLAEAALAIEHGDSAGLEGRFESLISDTTGTEYESLALAELALVRETTDEGIVDILQELQLRIRGWETPNLPQMMHDDTRIALLVRRREAVAARAEIARLTVDERHSQCAATWSARLALDAGDAVHTIELTAPCLAMGDAHSPRTATLAVLVTAAAHARLGDLRTADALFMQAVTLAAPTGSVRPFGILPRRELTVLASRARRSAESSSVRETVEAISARFPARDDAVPDRLSARELVVLSHLVAGATQQRISFELTVSPNTVKTQVRSIYRKLGVTSREGAVQRARALGIID